MFKNKIKHSNRKSYNWLIYQKIDDFLFQNVHLFKGTLYDLGCGEKPYEFFLKSYVDNYIGVDWGESLYNSKPEILTDLNRELPINDNSADCILSISVLEHLANPNKLLMESYRILKRDGIVVFQVPFQWKLHEAPYDYQRFTSFGLKQIFEMSGFVNVKVIPTGGIFTTIVLKFNYFLAKLVKGPKLIKLIIKSILYPFWTLTQYMALFLDKFDNNWDEETQGFWVIANKSMLNV